MREWLQVRKQLYHQIYSHVRAIEGKEPKALSKYRKVFEKEFRRWQACKKEDLFGAIQKASIVFLSDFHALRQSQRGHLRLLRAAGSERERVLILECIEAKHQRALDKFIKGSISEQEFLKLVKWDSSWGFPWEHYRPLFLWAREESVRVVAANLKVPSLIKRDRFAARIIAKIRGLSPKAQLVVIFGDMHLARPHLPAMVEKRTGQKNWIVVFQNSERIYFRLQQQDLELSVDVVKLGARQFCVLNVPPWVKWQNYLLFLEREVDSEIDEDAQLDYTDHIRRQMQVLAQDLDLQPRLDDFSVYTFEDPKLPKTFRKLPESRRKFFEDKIAEDVSFYLPELGLAYLSRASVNSAASLSMAILHAQTSRMEKYPAEMPNQFLALIWHEALQYFGSKLINPKRKTNTLTDIKAAVAARPKAELGQDALRLALSQKVQEFVYLTSGRRMRSKYRPKRRSSYRVAARILGGMLGEKIYFGFRKKLVSKSQLQKWLSRDFAAAAFESFYFETMELLDHLPEPFVSKSEKM